MSPRKTKAILTRRPTVDEILKSDLAKLRAAILMATAEYGRKQAVALACVTQLRAEGHRASVRSIYRWRTLYTRSGFAGLTRRPRADRGRSKIPVHVLLQIVDAAARLRRRRNMAGEFRRVKPGISYASFRRWVLYIQAQWRDSGTPQRREAIAG
jgi:hypothetical protein